MTRRPLLLAAALLTLAAMSPSRGQSAPLPLRNLLVEVRQGEASTLAQRSAGIGGARIEIGGSGGTRGSVDGTLDARFRDNTSNNSGQATQQLLVLNGGSAALNIGTSTPLQWLSWVWTPNGPRQVGSSSINTGRSVQVQPSWTGGDAPVRVELRSTSASPTGQRGAVEQANALSTLAVPLGEWITVASADSSASQRDRGLLSANDSSTTRGFVVELRVTAP